MVVIFFFCFIQCEVGVFVQIIGMVFIVRDYDFNVGVDINLCIVDLIGLVDFFLDNIGLFKGYFFSEIVGEYCKFIIVKVIQCFGGFVEKREVIGQILQQFIVSIMVKGIVYIFKVVEVEKYYYGVFFIGMYLVDDFLQLLLEREMVGYIGQ